MTPTSSTTNDIDWAPHARRLADTLAANGGLRDPRWHAAVAAVPRHVLVPQAYEQKPTGEWEQFPTATQLERVYSDETLVTALDTAGHTVPVSSSTKPDLMLRMLETLDVRDGHRVLEIGTGTGYNAALLAHRLGDDRVFSVDVDPELVDLARERLAITGHRPTLAAVDGITGLREHAPYDRIIATCSVPAVPWEWAEQLARDAAILVDLKLAVSAGNLVHLRQSPGRLEGRFTTRWAAFMAMRTATPAAVPVPAQRAMQRQRRPTDVPATPWTQPGVTWFLAQLRLPADITFGYDLDEDRSPIATTFAAADGSWARVGLTDNTVTEGGDTPLWEHIEWAHRQWCEIGQPGWGRLGLTVTPDGTHRVWLDEPTSTRHWELPLHSAPDT